MKASFLRKIWIMTCSAYHILSMCFKGIWYGARGQHEMVSRGLYNCAFALLDLVRPKINIYGHKEFPINNNKRYIIMCNHSSHYDIPLSFMAFGGANIRMIAKKELFRIPIFGQAMKCTKTVSIDRSNLERAIKNLDYAKKIMQEGFIIWISPEGSRLKNEDKQALKKGGFIMALQTQATVIPVYISDSEKILPAKTWDFYLNQEVSVKILPAIESSDYSMETLSEFMNAVAKTWEDANNN